MQENEDSERGQTLLQHSQKFCDPKRVRTRLATPVFVFVVVDVVAGGHTQGCLPACLLARNGTALHQLANLGFLLTSSPALPSSGHCSPEVSLDSGEGDYMGTLGVTKRAGEQACRGRGGVFLWRP